MQLGLDTEDEIIDSPLKYLDSIKEISIDNRAKWFFEIQTNRISQTNCLKFLELVEALQIKEDVPSKGAFLFSQGSTNERNWQTYHPGGFSFHACHVADVLLHLSSTNEVARNKAKLILKGIALFLKKYFRTKQWFFSRHESENKFTIDHLVLCII